MISFSFSHFTKRKFFVLVIAFLCSLAGLDFKLNLMGMTSVNAKEEMQATPFQKAIIKALIYQDIERLSEAFDIAGTQLGANLAKTHKDIIQIKVGDLASQYKEDELKAETTYRDKWLIVTGLISTLDKDINPPILQIKGDVKSTTEVLAFFKNPELELPFFSNLELNQPITLMCHGVERTPSPTLQKCEFIQTAMKPLEDEFEQMLIDSVEGKGNLQEHAIWAFTILRIEELLGEKKAKICEKGPAECLKAINNINPQTASKTIPKRFFELGYTENMLISGRTGL